MRLRRYTNIPVLLDTLIKRKITLLDPASWEDRNDAFFVEKYKEKKKLKTILALCFTTKAETFHHWKVFAGSSAGVCIRFNKDKLLDNFNGAEGIRADFVTYKLMRELKSKPPTVEQLPFIKRKQYEDEEEFRIIYENKTRAYATKDFAIDLQCIERITLSPWLPYDVSKTIKKVIQDLDGCASIELIKTGVVENKTWKNIACKVT